METSPTSVDLETLLKSDILKRLNVPLQWMDTHRESITRSLLPSEAGFAYGPCEPGNVQPKVPVRLPAVELHHFERAVISTHSSSVLLPDRLLIERVESVEPAHSDYVAGHIVAHNETQASVQMQGSVIDVPRGVFMAGNGSFNYYHFLIEILPRLQHLLGDDLLRNYPLLVDESVALQPNWREALDTVSGRHPYLVLPAHRSYRIGSLAYITSPNTFPLNLRSDLSYEVGHCLTRPSTIDFLRERFGVNNGKTVASADAHQLKRIFIARRPRLRNYNQDEISAVLAELGFTTMYMDALPVALQAGLLGNAEMVVGPSGAAWANLAFCRPGTKCLCWNADRGFSMFCNLAQAVGADLKYLFYETPVVSTRELYRLDYHLDPNALRRAIQLLQDS